MKKINDINYSFVVSKLESQIKKFAHAPESLNPISFLGIHKMSVNYIGEQRVARVVIACAQTKLNSDWLIRVHFRLRAGYSSESTRLPLQCGLGSSPGVDAIFGLSLIC